MFKKLSRYKNRIVAFVGVLTVLFGVCSFSFETKANVVDEYYLDYAEPATSDSQGYITLALYDIYDHEMEIKTFFWTSACYAEDGTELASFCRVNLSEDMITFAPFLDTQYYNTGMISVTRIDNTGVYVPYPVSTDSVSKVQWSPKGNGYELIGYKYGGNALVSQFSQTYEFALFFAEDGTSRQLMYIYSLLQSSNSLSQQQNSVLASIYSRVDDVENKLETVKGYLKTIRDDLGLITGQLDDILVEEKKQTTWLEKIWNSIQEFLGKEPADDAAPPVDEDDTLGSIQESEEILLPDTSDAEANLKVDINSGFGFLTSLIDAFAKLDQGVFSMYLTMLTFGVVALVLGR